MSSLLAPYLTVRRAMQIARFRVYSLSIVDDDYYNSSTGMHSYKGASMNHRAVCFAFGVLLSSLFAGFASAQDTKITVLNPRGIQPQIRRIPMAPRPATLDGKTIYVVDTRYPRTREFVEELFNILKEKYPKTNWVLRDKFGGYVDDDPKLWAEIKDKGHGMIMAVGH
jgi:hypothetical protein